MKIFLAQLAVLVSFPILFINSFGGIIAFVWLIFESEWTLIIQGIVAFFVSSFIFSGLSNIPLSKKSETRSFFVVGSILIKH